MDYSWILMLVLMFGMLYFFMIRPENKRKKEAENLRNSLAVGDEITTIGGMTGTVCAVSIRAVSRVKYSDRQPRERRWCFLKPMMIGAM